MPSIFTRKKSTPSAATPTPAQSEETTPPTQPQSSREGNGSAYVLPRRDSASIDQQRQQQRSPEKKNRSSFVKEREREAKDKRPKSPRNSKNFSTKSSRKDSDSHPLNLPPEELRRLSALSAARMGSPTNSEREESTEPMQESTPAPQSAPGAFPQTNGDGHHAEDSPAPPPHRTPTSPPPQPQQQQEEQKPAVDAEKCKETGNKFFKAKQYDKAIEEYTKGWFYAAGACVVATS